MSAPTAAKPMLDRKAADQISLNVLKRLDTDVEELLATAGHVALYDFDVPNTRWSRKDVEGSMFVVKRRGSPRFRFVILNKKSADNYVEDIGGGFQCELNEPYLLYRNKAGQVIGIWFFEQEDCARISSLFQRIASTFAAPEDERLNQRIENGSARNITSSSADAVSLSAPASASSAISTEPSRARPNGAQAAAGNARIEKEISSQQTAQKDDQNDDGDGDDDVFWDRKVAVPSEVPAPGAVAASIAAQPSAAAENALARVFAGMKMAPTSSSSTSSAAQQQSQQPAAPQPTALSQMPLLTPQFLRQQSASATSGAATAAAPATAVQQQQKQPQQRQQGAGMRDVPGVSQGAALLRSLQTTAAKDGAGEAVGTATSVMAKEKGAAGSDGAKAAALLRALASNAAVCEQVGAEMRRVGLI